MRRLFHPDGDEAAGAQALTEAASETPPATGDGEAPTSTATEPKTPAPDDVQRELTELREYRQHAERLMDPEVQGEARVESTRYVMRRSGYTDSDIDSYLKAMEGGGEPPAPEPAATPSPASEPEKREQTGVSREELAAMEEDRIAGAKDIMKLEMRRVVDHAVDTDPSLRLLFEKSRELAGDEGFDDRKANIVRDFREALTDRLKSRSRKGERFSLEWFGEEAPKAALQIADRLRSVIGDPNRVMRAPETVTGDDTFRVRGEPMKPPVLGPTDGPAEAQEKVLAWNEDVLLRAAAELDREGSTRA